MRHADNAGAFAALGGSAGAGLGDFAADEMLRLADDPPRRQRHPWPDRATVKLCGVGGRAKSDFLDAPGIRAFLQNILHDVSLDRPPQLDDTGIQNQCVPPA